METSFNQQPVSALLWEGKEINVSTAGPQGERRGGIAQSWRTHGYKGIKILEPQQKMKPKRTELGSFEYSHPFP